MRQDDSDWFATVAMDLFSAAFVAVLIIESATPKEPARPPVQSVLFQVRYRAAAQSPCLEPAAIVVSFLDAAHRRHSTLDPSNELAGQWQRQSDYCLYQAIADLPKGDPPVTKPFVVIGEFAGRDEQLCVEMNIGQSWGPLNAKECKR
jgi:hypothetical protein